MTITITLGWWLAPAIITVVLFVWAFWPLEVYAFSKGPSVSVVQTICTLGAAVVSLAAWLVWALCA